jgi:hypothetical protein
MLASKPFVEHGPVDLILDNAIRVQCKTRTLTGNNSQGYKISLQRHKGNRGGEPLRRAYAPDEFDLLAVFVFDGQRALGAFLVPMEVLVQKGLLGLSSVLFYPPSASLSRRRAIDAQAWQAHYFVEARERYSSEDIARIQQVPHPSSVPRHPGHA